MRNTRLLISLCVFPAMLLACMPAPKRPKFGNDRIDSGNSNPNKPTDPDDPNNPEDPEKPDAVDHVKIKGNIDKIMSTDDSICEGKPEIGRSILRLLTREEYQNSVRDILKIPTDYRGRLPEQSVTLSFRNNADSSVITDSQALSYQDVAISIGDEVQPQLATLAQCTGGDLSEACAQKVLSTVAPLLFRRPLEEIEKTSLLATYRSGLATSPREGMTLLFASLLTSPQFLYRSEIGKDGKLTAYELASALSFFFWGTSPDDSLRTLAASGGLLESSTLLKEAQRLWSDKKSKHATTEFARAYLKSQSVRGSVKDTAKFPGFTDAIKIAMSAEAEDSMDTWIRTPSSTFDLLYSADYTVGPDALATYYKGQVDWANGAPVIKFPNTPRKGILGLGAVLAYQASSTETHPVKRGHFVLENLLCHIPDPLPPGIEVQVPMTDPNATTRERFAKHSSSVTCKGCHEMIDGIGFGMEDFDSAAIFRETDNGKPVDATGEIVNIDKKRTKFDGTADLGAYLASSRQAKRCYVVQWFRLTHGHIEREADVCSIRTLANEFESGQVDLSQLIVKMITSPAYLERGE